MNNIYFGNTPYIKNDSAVSGEFVVIENEKYYKISNFNNMPDFFMTIVSDSDHWMFLSSNGSLSAGRKDRDNAIFPYYTDDKIHHYCGITGNRTIVLVERNDRTSLWEPFTKNYSNIYNIERNIYKSEYGNKVLFEEINNDLGISFKYSWSNSAKFGFVKKSLVSNQNDSAVKVKILDGISNILPSGTDYDFQNEYSNLLDGYKKCELIEETGLGLFLLSSIPVDKAEPSESLTATVIWSTGLAEKKILLSNKQLEHFKSGLTVETETDIKATRGSYYVIVELELEAQQNHDWMIVAEINQSTTEVANLNLALASDKQLATLVNNDIQEGTSNLVSIVAAADGLQSSNEELCSARHFSNTLFNIMRGGTYLNNYRIETSDFKDFVTETNAKLGAEFQVGFNALSANLSSQELLEMAAASENADLIRIVYEYLPLTFSRRHGDPSRPWNLFSIENKNEDGTAKSDYQGNWRDIFQNWEALSLSYPEFIEHIICKFINASTADGYNPYRIMRSGIDWECPDENDPWAYIGYWGDHQIIYLQKLLELSDNYHPGKIEELLSKEIFAYANVPYRIKSYQDILLNPQDTIEFDFAANKKIQTLATTYGSDGRLIMNNEQNVIHVNLTEKILVTLLTKLSNFIPEAGIWLNTQRPEWNDANNALVGNGASMVTLCYLRRFLKFWNEKFSTIAENEIYISEEVAVLFNSIFDIFSKNTNILESGFTDNKRRLIADLLGQTGSDFRNKIYSKSFSGNKKSVTAAELTKFTQLAMDYVDQSIKVNKDTNGLYHAYNLISFNDDSVSIRHLYEMLEGQVAVLSSGYLSISESADVLDCLKWSELFIQNQYSYLLYPNRDLPRFNEKNNIPAQAVKGSELLTKLLTDKDRSIITIDNSGQYHFTRTFRNAEVLSQALDALDSAKYQSLLTQEKTKVLDIYEEIFDHKSYTGRSGTFYAYEGLGSIYWHMVSKLLLAVEECYFRAADEKVDPVIIGRIKDHYYEIKAGIGLYKTPELYGAFPTDAYSHTPENSGVKQPGMTGQVKEDVISRMACLGVRVKHGQITFDGRLLNHKEFLKDEGVFKYISIDNCLQQLNLKQNQLSYTLCQIPVVYTLSDTDQKIVITYTDNHQEEIAGNSLNQQISRLIFNRKNEIKLLEVSIN
ncbi:MAG: hypothetical protein ACI9N9_001025 [Enterobacterales bacterium]|jgi:hypothetical protein